MRDAPYAVTPPLRLIVSVGSVVQVSWVRTSTSTVPSRGGSAVTEADLMNRSRLRFRSVSASFAGS